MKTMKKAYLNPQVDIVKIPVNRQMLTISVGGSGGTGGSNGDYGGGVNTSREFDYDEEEE